MNSEKPDKNSLEKEKLKDLEKNDNLNLEKEKFETAPNNPVENFNNNSEPKNRKKSYKKIPRNLKKTRKISVEITQKKKPFFKFTKNL